MASANITMKIWSRMALLCAVMLDMGMTVTMRQSAVPRLLCSASASSPPAASRKSPPGRSQLGLCGLRGNERAELSIFAALEDTMSPAFVPY